MPLLRGGWKRSDPRSPIEAASYPARDTTHVAIECQAAVGPMKWLPT
jgi:hypothetical protein